MKVNYRKGLKPWVMKYMALLIGVCYLANPFHQVIYTVFHDVSHIISLPNVTVSASKINQNGELSFYHEHDHLQAHNHTTLNLMEALINPSEALDLESKKVLSTHLIDKHISINTLLITKQFLTVFKGDDAKPVKKVIAGFLKIIDLPPQCS